MQRAEGDRAGDWGRNSGGIQHVLTAVEDYEVRKQADQEAVL